MRPDMDKVLVERERDKPWGGMGFRSIRAQLKRENLEDATTHIPMRSIYSYDRKSFGENLGPLKRFLESRVGHKWDDINSEVREHIDTGNQVQNHILQHMYDYVELNCTTIDGKIYKSDGEDLRHYMKYYVDQTGILKKVPQRPVRIKEKKNDEVKIDDMLYAEKIEGIWYIIQYARITETPTLDVITKQNVFIEHVPAKFIPYMYDPSKQYFIRAHDIVRGTPHRINNKFWNLAPTKDSWIAISKKQMNKKELKQYIK